MIYTNIVNTKAPMKIEKLRDNRDFSFFKDYEPQSFPYPANEKQEREIKLNHMKIIIAGTMTDLHRNNDNLKSRSLLFLDIDGVQEPETDMMAKIELKLNGFNYALYPTLKYKPIENVRYRLVVELDREVNAEDYQTLIFGLYETLGIVYTFDQSNKTFSQAQALPIITEYTKEAQTRYQDDKKVFPVDTFLKIFRNNPNYTQAKPKQKPFYKSNHTNKKYTGAFLDELVAGAEHFNRNNWITRQIGRMLSVGADLETVYKMIVVVNENFLPEPLTQKEVYETFESMTKKHSRGA
ncbi:hypothetical protein IGK74_000558 [Enterococcus sp. AZ150]|uniref:primase alpha helix C-terminal domain-containing protein n=1 Tax=Enterococcus sp. AZ150 TaxID=2774866 RepID=UPI003F23F02A